MSTKVIMPQLGESVVEGTVTKWLHKVGETVQELESLLEINTDKVDAEIPSPASGTLLKIVVPEGTTVNAGTVLAWIGQPGEIPDEEVMAIAGGDPALAPMGAVQAAAVAAIPQAGQTRDLGFISPVVARLAREHNLDLGLVKGSGEGGRITKRDVLAYLEASPALTGQVKP
jgi:pyruvate/2-oxoglutarate dehydrogenase complex dihydrolipoamide acyltransferase (E2) component